MKSKEIPFRGVGQRAIDSSFLSSSSNPFKDRGNKAPGKSSPLSLSDFLEKKLSQSTGLVPIVTGKSKPFSCLVGPREISRPIDEAEKGGDSNSKSAVEKVVLEQFKPRCVEIIANDDSAALSGDVGGGAGHCLNDVGVGGSRKRKFQGERERQVPRKHFAVLGSNPKRRQRRIEDSIAKKEDQLPAYNHYANGGGFWDSDMEGVDNEEVGFSEVWEGVGSTTFGGIADWH